MHRPNTRRSVASIVCLVVVGSLSLTACVLPPDPNAAANSAAASDGAVVVDDAASEGALAIPASWPSSVPVYEGGTLTTAEGDPAGNFFSATWDVEDTPDAVATEYGAVLTAAGLTAGTPYSDDTSALNEYTGSDLTVTVYASTSADGDGTELSVTVQPAA